MSSTFKSINEKEDEETIRELDMHKNPLQLIKEQKKSNSLPKKERHFLFIGSKTYDNPWEEAPKF
jgi:hypothetical protein